MAAVAFLGLGRMGARMATNLAAADHDLTLYNRTAATAATLAMRLGARTAETPRQAAAAADVLITMVADEDALQRVCHGADGILAGLRPGAILVDMGTTGPDGIARLAPDVEAAGATLVDAPVSGSTQAAEAGALTILVGAPQPAFERLAPILRAVGERIYHLGGTGAGSVMKLAVNNVIYALGNGLSESLVLAERAGLARAVVYEVFEHSAVAAPMVAYRREAFLDPEGTPAAFAMTLARKDLELIAGLADAVGVEVEQAEANLSMFRKAIDAGLGNHDMADMAVYLRDRAENG